MTHKIILKILRQLIHFVAALILILFDQLLKRNRDLKMQLNEREGDTKIKSSSMHAFFIYILRVAVCS